MAETPLKRQREETQIENFEESKRFKSYSQILSLLDEAEEDEPTEDLSSLITTLQQELETDLENPNTDSATSSSSFSEVVLKEDDDVIRHLLEASDDELGIPNMEVGDHDGEEDINCGDGFSWCDGLWELEDEAANYYTFLQSQLFM